MALSIGVIGTGYVGLVTGTCLAEVGNNVLCIDIDPAKIAKLRQGVVPIYEPGLDRIMTRNIREGRLHFSLDVADAVASCSILMLCLPTPPGEDGSADLSYVLQATERIATLIAQSATTEPRILVNKSTVPVGTTAAIAAVVERHAPGCNITVVSNPEFLREGFAVEDFLKPDRIVIGTSNPAAEATMRELYAPFEREGALILVFDEKSAEVTKYASNSFLATKISFMNDLSEYCERVGADIENIRIGMGADDRIGKRFLFAGIGYGGSCFPKDVRALVHSARSTNTPLEILEAVMDVNRSQAERFAQRVVRHFADSLKGHRVALWGLAFKPDTDDTREAPAFVIARALLDAGATVAAYDPEAVENTRLHFGDTLEYAASALDACKGASALVIATEWNEFRRPDWNALRNAMTAPVVFDGRNLFDLAEMQRSGMEYHSVGRASVNAG
jgi:UDPglucose 6-dehydrogenase